MNVLHSQGKGVSQAPTSSQQKNPCSAQLVGSSSPAPRTSCGRTHPDGAATFWLSTTVRWDRVGAQHFAGAPGTPALPWPGPGSPPHSAQRELPLLITLPLPLVIAPFPLPGRGGRAAEQHPLRVPLGLTSSASHVLRQGRLSPSLFSFSHFR